MTNGNSNSKQKQTLHLHQTTTDFSNGGQVTNFQWQPTSSNTSTSTNRPQDPLTSESGAGAGLRRSRSTPHSTFRHPPSSHPKRRLSQTSTVPAYYGSSLLSAYIPNAPRPPENENIPPIPRRSSRRPQGPQYPPAAPSTYAASSLSSHHPPPATPQPQPLRRARSNAPRRHQVSSQHETQAITRKKIPYASAARPAGIKNPRAVELQRSYTISHSPSHSQSRHYPQISRLQREEMAQQNFVNPRAAPRVPKETQRAEGEREEGHGVAYEKTRPSSNPNPVRTTTSPQPGFLERFFHLNSHSHSHSQLEEKGNGGVKRSDMVRTRRRERQPKAMYGLYRARSTRGTIEVGREDGKKRGVKGWIRRIFE